FHSLSPPCDHSADTPGPLMPQPGAFARGRFIQEGFCTGSPVGLVAKPRMFSASYQRYSGVDLGAEGFSCASESEGRKMTERTKKNRLPRRWLVMQVKDCVTR